ncbi:MAG: DUF975 family protein [Butyrivibrio sp.]|nr:DUF975 family protein [Butyrivibrio sp.]
MGSYKTSAQLKGIAREQSLGRYGTLIGANVIIFAIQLFVSGLTTVSTSGSILLIIINNLITIIVNILLGILMSGKAYLYMNLLYSQPVSTSDIFFGLKQQPQKAVIIQSVFVLVDFLVSLPAQVILAIYSTNPTAELMAAMIFALAIGLIVNVYVSLMYSQSFFLLHDFPDKSAKELLSSSRLLMRGSKFRLFYLNVSFIPLYLLGCITMFIPLLWIGVYRYATNCAFYQDLIANTAKREVTYGPN